MCLATLAALLVLCGCGGINTSQSVSPASFFLPGLLKAAPVGPSPGSVTPLAEPDHQLAQVR